MSTPQAGSDCPIRAAAVEALDAGISVIAIRRIGETYHDPEQGDKVAGPKQPKGLWKKYQSERAGRSVVRRWLTETHGRGFAVICGRVSGNLEMLEFDDPQVRTAFETAAEAAGLKPVLDRIRAGYLETSPKGGPHLPYKCDVIGGSTKLAQRPTGEADDRARVRLKTLIETKGEGGYFVAAPSPGTVHASGKPYVRVCGSFATIQTITVEERAALLALAVTFDEMPDPPPPPPKAGRAKPRPDGALRPGDDYNQRATLDMWSELLEPLGWKCTGRSERRQFWKHDHTDKDVSAVVGGTKNRMTVFSSSTIFKQWSQTDPASYDPFAAYTTIHHRGDFRAAAKALAARGYGTPPAKVKFSGSERATSGHQADVVEKVAVARKPTVRVGANGKHDPAKAPEHTEANEVAAVATQATEATTDEAPCSLPTAASTDATPEATPATESADPPTGADDDQQEDAKPDRPEGPYDVGGGYAVKFRHASRGMTEAFLFRDQTEADGHKLDVRNGDRRSKLADQWSGRHDGLDRTRLMRALVAFSFFDPLNKPKADQGGTPDDGPIEQDDDPHKLARLALPEIDGPVPKSLRSWRGDWYLWRSGEYRRLTDDNAAEAVTRAVKKVVDRLAAAQHAAWLANGQPGDEPAPVKVSTRLVSDVMNAMRSVRAVGDEVEVPAWLADRPPEVPAEADVIPCRNGLLVIPRDLAAGGPRLIGHTRMYFNHGCLPFDYDPAAPEPAEWLKFLNGIWPDDPGSIEALQEFFGYNATDDMRIQKNLLLIGPPRSGKGVVMRTLERMVGERLFCSSSLTKLGRPFGLAQVVGKRVLGITDARVSRGPEVMVALENLLKITGNDSVPVERKNRDEYTARLKCHVVVAANELPRFSDVSNALAERFIIFETRTSFAGREDPFLEDRITPELPSILRWALAGLARLRERGQFQQPESGTEQAKAWREMSSPVKAFVDERCAVGRGFQVARMDLWSAWEKWAKESNHPVGDAFQFGRDLHSAFPGKIKRTQPRVGKARKNLYEGIALKPEGEADEEGGPADERRVDTLRELLPVGPPGSEADVILRAWVHQNWPDPPSKGRLLGILSAGVRAGEWHQAAAGAEGDQFRFWQDGPTVHDG